MENTKLFEKMMSYIIDNMVTKNDLVETEDRLMKHLTKLVHDEVEGLALITANGFAETVTKDELREVRDELKAINKLEPINI